VGRRKALRGTAIVFLGALLLILSLVFDWVKPEVEPGIALPGEDDSESKPAAIVLVPAALATVVLVTIAQVRTAAWPFVYTRVLGACSLAATAWAVFEAARPVRAGVLFAAIAGAMIITGSSAALSREAETEVPIRG
jgi:hypothetical protein